MCLNDGYTGGNLVLILHRVPSPFHITFRVPWFWSIKVSKLKAIILRSASLEERSAMATEAVPQIIYPTRVTRHEIPVHPGHPVQNAAPPLLNFIALHYKDVGLRFHVYFTKVD